MKLLGISGTIIGSKTAVLVKKALEEVQKKAPDIEVEFLDLKHFDLQFCNGRDPETYNEDTKKVIELVSQADCYIIGTPIFQGSITAVLKNIFDLIHPHAMRHKVVGLVASGGTYQHYLVIENQLKPILGYFRCYTAPSFVYAHADHFNEHNEIVDPDILERMTTMVEEVLHMQKALQH